MEPRERSDLRSLLVQAALLRLLLRAGLALLPFPTVVRLAGTLGNLLAALPRGALPRGTLARGVRRIAWAVQAAGRRFPPERSCLIEALAAKALLDAERRPSRLRFGVAASAGGRFEAHAWIECDGEIVVGAPGLENFRPLVPLAAEGTP